MTAPTAAPASRSPARSRARAEVGSRWLSPLRYPGGKARMAGFLGETLQRQWSPMDIEIWMEPFAGGAGAGLALLEAEVVQELWLVEKNPSLAAFWRTVKDDGERFAAQVEVTAPTMGLWAHARETLAAAETGEALPDADLAFAAFIANRCSRSGIISPRVGPIGGKHQSGQWTVASRFNGLALAERIRRVAAYGSRLRVMQGDAVEHIRDLTDSGIEQEMFLFVDPPYIREGNQLYAHGMTGEQHRALAEALTTCPAPWVLTYDDEPLVATDLYPQHRIVEFEIAHTANRQRVAKEYAVFSDTARLDPLPRPLERGDVRWVREHPDQEHDLGRSWPEPTRETA